MAEHRSPPPPPISRHGFHPGLSPRAANILGIAIIASGALGMLELFLAAAHILAKH